MHGKKLNKEELSLLNILFAELAKLSNEIEAATTAEASHVVRQLRSHRREVIRQINELFKH